MRTLSNTSSRSWVSPRHELVVPREVAGLGIERERAVGVEGVAVGAARQPRPRLGLRSGPVGEVGDGVVAARNPRVAAGPERRREVAPGVAPRVAGLGNRRRAPQLGPAVRVVGGDEAGAVLVPLAAGHAGDDPAVDDDRSARVPVAEPGVGDGVIPDHLAVPGRRGRRCGRRSCSDRSCRRRSRSTACGRGTSRPATPRTSCGTPR